MEHQLSSLVDSINANSFLFLNDQDVDQIRERAHNSSVYKPSGPRCSGEGVSDDRQGILSAQLSEDRFCCVLKITTLAAGFVVGRHGATIRTLCDKTGAKSISWCQTYGDGIVSSPLDIRVCLIKGTTEAIYGTVDIICKAVQRYQDLVNGRCDERVVQAEQVIEGISFIYKPPPTKAMPESARVASKKSKKSRKNANQKKQLQQQVAPLQLTTFGQMMESTNSDVAIAYPSSSPVQIAQYDSQSSATTPTTPTQYSYYDPYNYYPTSSPLTATISCPGLIQTPFPPTSTYPSYDYPSSGQMVHYYYYYPSMY
eukprot:TRINITY_DN36454_c0_g1_i3.p1 TRINITY_DN36454_c0_g1~~TRINITY_DN36454_c0_g1_i3.p1  ORF type:complete len:313 (+),score=29.99 TRINITY_DN36454_c0_g1_i3:156-1094(+)